MNSRLYFVTAFIFKIAASQTFTHSTLAGSEQPLTLRCVTVDLNDIISFKLGNDNKGGCFADGSCSTGITGYEQPIQQGTNITEMVITSCNKTRDAGSWTCAYGALTSDPIVITECSGVTTTEDPSTTQHDVTTETTERQFTNDTNTTMTSTGIICTTPICIYIAALYLSLRYSISFL